MYKKVLFIFLIVIYFLGCSSFYGDEQLGSGYFIWRDGRYASLVYNKDKKEADGGYTVIEENVIETKVNEKYIIVKSVKYNDKKQRVLSYWIIDKSKRLDFGKCKDQKSYNIVLKSNVIKKSDSLSFKKILKGQNIDLSFDSWN